jgi:hypothetical protein
MKKIYKEACDEYKEFMNGASNEDYFHYNILRRLIYDDGFLPHQEDLAILKKYDCIIFSTYNVEKEEIGKSLENSRFEKCLDTIKNLEENILPTIEETRQIIISFEEIEEECKHIKREVKYIDLLTIKLYDHYSKDLKGNLKTNELDKTKIILSLLESEIRFDDNGKTDEKHIVDNLNSLRQVYEETALWEKHIVDKEGTITIYAAKMNEVLGNIKVFLEEGKHTLAKRLLDDLDSISTDRKSFLIAYQTMTLKEKITVPFEPEVKIKVDKELRNLKGFTWNKAAWLIINELVNNVHEKTKLVYSKYSTI